jgi:hypothetical protein
MATRTLHNDSDKFLSYKITFIEGTVSLLVRPHNLTPGNSVIATEVYRTTYTMHTYPGMNHATSDLTALHCGGPQHGARREQFRSCCHTSPLNYCTPLTVRCFERSISNLDISRVECNITRMRGGWGGKEENSCGWGWRLKFRNGRFGCNV